MIKFLNKNGVINTSQFRFRINSSTDLAITSFYDHHPDNLNENKITFSFFLDFKKAFDSVDHQLPLKSYTVMGFGDLFLA